MHNHIAGFATFFLLSQACFGQLIVNQKNHLQISARYTQEFVLGGYVQVREWDFAGDKLRLGDLGMRNYPAIQLSIEQSFQGRHWISLSYDRYFITGKSTFNRDIAFNGTLIDGNHGIDVSPTQYFRASLNYRCLLFKTSKSELQYSVGLVMDHITFWLNGTVSAASPRDEVFEKFGRQALPYPVLGLGGKIRTRKAGSFNYSIAARTSPSLKVYIPKMVAYIFNTAHYFQT